MARLPASVIRSGRSPTFQLPSGPVRLTPSAITKSSSTGISTTFSSAAIFSSVPMLASARGVTSSGSPRSSKVMPLRRSANSHSRTTAPSPNRARMSWKSLRTLLATASSPMSHKRLNQRSPPSRMRP